MPQCNNTLDGEPAAVAPGVGNLSYRTFGNYLLLGFTGVAILVTFFHIFMHAITYSRPTEQRHIIRILFMVPLYAAVSALSYNYVRHAISFEILRDVYESVCIAAFFALMCHFIRPNLHEQKDFFRRVNPKPWIWPLSWLRRCTGGEHRGLLRTPRSGLTWFNIIWIGIFQYVFFRPAMTILAVITQAFDRYCESSLNPVFAHIWVIVIEATAVSVAMYCIIQFYYETRRELAPHKPLIKILSIKLVIFFSFWQNFVISILSSGRFLHTSDKISFSDIKIGLPAFLVCAEMMLFSILHLFAYHWRPYVVPRGSLNPAHHGKQQRYYGGFLGVKAILHALNPLDLVKGLARGTRWLFVGVRRREQDARIGMEPMKSDTLFPGAADPDDDTDNASLSYSKPLGPTSSVGNYSPWPSREDERPLNPGKTPFSHSQSASMTSTIGGTASPQKMNGQTAYDPSPARLPPAMAQPYTGYQGGGGDPSARIPMHMPSPMPSANPYGQTHNLPAKSDPMTSGSQSLHPMQATSRPIEMPEASSFQPQYPMTNTTTSPYPSTLLNDPMRGPREHLGTGGPERTQNAPPQSFYGRTMAQNADEVQRTSPLLRGDQDDEAIRRSPAFGGGEFGGVTPTADHATGPPGSHQPLPTALQPAGGYAGRQQPQQPQQPQQQWQHPYPPGQAF